MANCGKKIEIQKIKKYENAINAKILVEIIQNFLFIISKLELIKSLNIYVYSNLASRYLKIINLYGFLRVSEVSEGCRKF